MTSSPTFQTDSRAAFDAVEHAVGTTPDVTIDHSGSILTMRFSNGDRCTLNRQDSIEQIWLADGPLSWHFERDPLTHRWADTIGRGPLFEIVGAMLTRRLGRRVTLTA